MQDNGKRIFYLGSLAALLAMVLAFFSLTSPARAAAASTSATWSGQTIDWANVRTGTTSSASIVQVDAPGTPVTVYATVYGQAVASGNSTWDRISSTSSMPLYIYGALVTTASSPGTGGVASSIQGKVIVVSLSQQWLFAYQNGQQVFNTAVMSGRPDLETPTGTFHVFAKLSPTTFYSPFPSGSVNWYPPTHINYALEFLSGGFFLHDSWWHTVYGPGTNVWHYGWAPIGTTVQITA